MILERKCKSYKGDRVEAVYEHPEQRHEGNEMPNVQRRRSWIYTHICSDTLVDHQLIENVTFSAKHVRLACSFAHKDWTIANPAIELM